MSTEGEHEDKSLVAKDLIGSPEHKARLIISIPKR
jgi:hypothetical protein